MQRPAVLALVLAATAAVPALRPPAQDVEVTTVKVTDAVSMLVGRGGNVGLVHGDDGVLMIDAQFADMTDRLGAAIDVLSDGKLRYLVNTHWHFDHTGGNANIAAGGAVILAHENVRTRVSRDQEMPAFGRTVEALPEAARPAVTFGDEVTVHVAGRTVRAFHVDDAHTDGDVILHVVEDDVFHMGDTFFNGLYPFIDAGSGGHIDGMIAVADTVLAMAARDTRIIPGHGPLAGRAELQAFRDMLADVSARVHEALDAGLTRDEIIASRPTAAHDAAWGGGFLAPDAWVGIVVDGILARR